MIRRGDLRAEKFKYEDGGVGCCIWYACLGTDGELGGPCWDFDFDDLDDIISMLEELRKAPIDEEET